MFKDHDCIDFNIYTQLYKLTCNDDNIVVIWKDKTYKYGTWLYRL